MAPEALNTESHKQLKECTASSSRNTGHDRLYVALFNQGYPHMCYNRLSKSTSHLESRSPKRHHETPFLTATVHDEDCF